MKTNLTKTFRYENQNGENVIFEYDYGYMINKPTGVDTLSVNLSRASGFNQIGDSIQSAKIQARPINFSGYIWGENQAESKEQLLSVIRPDIRGRLYADKWYLDVVPTATPNISVDTFNASFQFSLLAGYPYWVNDEIIASHVDGGGLFTINNIGQVYVPYILEFTATGAVTNPKITDTKTNRFVELERVMQPNEVIKLIITHDIVRVKSSVDGYIDGTLTVPSNMFRLPTGQSEWQVSAQSGIENLKTKLNYKIERVGILA